MEEWDCGPPIVAPIPAGLGPLIPRPPDMDGADIGPPIGLPPIMDGDPPGRLNLFCLS